MKPRAFDALGRRAGEFPVGGRHVVDGQDRQAVALVDGAQLPQQPFPVGGLHFLVAARVGVPSLEERLGGDHLHLVLDRGTISKPRFRITPDAGKALVQRLDHPHEALLLRRLVELLCQPVRIQRVEEEAPIAFLPKGSDHPGGEEFGPLGGRLVDHLGVPGAVAGHLPGIGNVAEIRESIGNIAAR